MSPRRPRYVDLLAHLDRARATGVVLGLERTRAALARLGDPQLRSVTVHIAGTNGKGSTAAMTESILRSSGIRTGLYTSPHLCRFTERIRVAGREAAGDELAALAERIVATGIALTYFEFATVLAFLLFAERAVEVAVIETGLGGRLDATTTCEPVATAITSIALDHAEVLGPTLTDIAREKAGIAKPHVPLFLAALPAEADAEIAAVAARVGAPVKRVGQDFFTAAVPPVALAGRHQRTNAAVAIALADAAAQRLGRKLTEGAIEAGLRDVVWPGRLEWIRPDLLLDCAHNPEGAAVLADELDRHPVRPRVLVFSVVGGKRADQMLAILVGRFDAIFLTRSSNDRSVDPVNLARMFPEGLRLPVFSHFSSATDALGAATDWLRNDDGAGMPGSGGVIVAAGSTFLVGDIRAAVLGEASDPLPTSDPISLP